MDELLGFLRGVHSQVSSARSAVENVRQLRLMLFGVPNVGKSSLANRLLGSQKAPFGAKPGLTRGSNWLRGKGFVTVLDTPGVLDTSMAKGDARMKLAASWALNEKAYDVQQVAHWLVSHALKAPVPSDYITEFGRARGFLGPGGTVEYERSCKAVVQAFRNGDLGRLTLERPVDFEGGDGSDPLTGALGKEHIEEP